MLKNRKDNIMTYKRHGLQLNITNLSELQQMSLVTRRLLLSMLTDIQMLVKNNVFTDVYDYIKGTTILPFISDYIVDGDLCFNAEGNPVVVVSTNFFSNDDSNSYLTGVVISDYDYSLSPLQNMKNELLHGVHTTQTFYEGSIYAEPYIHTSLKNIK